MSSGSTASAAPAQVPPKRLPEGAENRLRMLWKTAHGMNVPGGWLLTEAVMAPIFIGLHAKNQSLHVPDVATLLRRSLLNQKSAKGTLITDHGTEQLDYSMSPCTTHPELFPAYSVIYHDNRVCEHC